MKAIHNVLGEVEIIDASEGLAVLIEHDGQTKEVLRRSVTPLPTAELRRREQAEVTNADRAFAIAQGEAECREQATDWPQPYSALVREQAQHTPGAVEAQWKDDLLAEKDNLIDALKTEIANQSFLAAKDMERQKAADARNADLAADNDRLRGLLAQITAIAEDSLDLARDRHTEASYARRIAAIEAAKEATK